jgi:hypothetical protein
MKFNPIKKEVFTDSGEFIKKMDCPYRVYWENLEVLDATQRKCEICTHSIVDTAFFSDDELINMVRQNPATCFKINLNQPNIKIVPNVGKRK